MSSVHFLLDWFSEQVFVGKYNSRFSCLTWPCNPVHFQIQQTQEVRYSWIISILALHAIVVRNLKTMIFMASRARRELRTKQELHWITLSYSVSAQHPLRVALDTNQQHQFTFILFWRGIELQKISQITLSKTVHVIISELKHYDTLHRITMAKLLPTQCPTDFHFFLNSRASRSFSHN